MLRELGVRNFKPFGQAQSVPLRRITLIYGPNSGGKTSLIQALLLLRQSLVGSENRAQELRPKGDLVDLTSFRTLVHHNLITEPLDLSLGVPYVSPWVSEDDAASRDAESRKSSRIRLRYERAGEETDRERRTAVLNSIALSLDDIDKGEIDLIRAAKDPFFRRTLKTFDPHGFVIADECSRTRLARCLLEVVERTHESLRAKRRRELGDLVCVKLKFRRRKDGTSVCRVTCGGLESTLLGTGRVAGERASVAPSVR